MEPSTGEIISVTPQEKFIPGRIDWKKLTGNINTDPVNITKKIEFTGGGLQKEVKGLILDTFTECRSAFGLDNLPNVFLQSVKQAALGGTPAEARREVTAGNIDYKMLVSEEIIPDAVRFADAVNNPDILKNGFDPTHANPVDAKEVAHQIIRTMNIIAHETYHMRQYETSTEYYIQKQAGENTGTSDPDEYRLLTKERGARAVALRYLIEKERMMGAKKQSTGLTPLEDAVHRFMREEITDYLNQELQTYGKQGNIENILKNLYGARQPDTGKIDLSLVLQSLLKEKSENE